MVIEAMIGGFVGFMIVLLGGAVWAMGEQCPHDDPRAAHATECR